MKKKIALLSCLLSIIVCVASIAQVTPVGKSYTKDQVWSQLLYKNGSGQVGVRFYGLDTTGLVPNQNPSIGYGEDQVLSQILYEDGSSDRAIGVFFDGILGGGLPPSTVGGSILIGTGSGGWEENTFVQSKSATPLLHFIGPSTGIIQGDASPFLGAIMSFEASGLSTSWPAFQFVDNVGTSTRILMQIGGEAAGNILFSHSGVERIGAASVTPSISIGGAGAIYFDGAASKFKVSENGGPYVDLVGSGGTLPASTALNTLLVGDGAGAWTAGAGDVLVDTSNGEITLGKNQRIISSGTTVGIANIVGATDLPTSAQELFVIDETAYANADEQIDTLFGVKSSTGWYMRMDGKGWTELGAGDGVSDAMLEVVNPGATGGIPTFQATDKDGNSVFQVFDKGRAVIYDRGTNTPLELRVTQSDVLLDLYAQSGRPSYIRTNFGIPPGIESVLAHETGFVINNRSDTTEEALRLTKSLDHTVFAARTDGQVVAQGMFSSIDSNGGDAGLAVKNVQDVAQSTVVTSGTVASQSGGGVAWTNVNNVLVQDNVGASVVLGSGQVSNNLEVIGFNLNLSIPSDAEITGMQVQVTWRGSGTLDLGIGQSHIAVSDGVTSYGGMLFSYVPVSWATSGHGGDYWTFEHWWTPSELASNSFGPVLVFKAGTGGATVDVDWVGIQVWYRLGGVEYRLTQSAPSQPLKLASDSVSPGIFVDLVTFNAGTKEVSIADTMTAVRERLNLANVISTQSPYTAGNETYIAADATGGAIIVDLPAVLSNTGYGLTVKKIDASANTVTINGTGGATIDGAATRVIGSQYTSVTVVSDGTNWLVM